MSGGTTYNFFTIFRLSANACLVAHKLVIIRGTPVYLDLMEKQLSKEQISELMSMQDDKGNTPVHLLGESSVLIFDRLIPYIKNCWTIKNKRYELTPILYQSQRKIIIIEPLTRVNNVTNIMSAVQKSNTVWCLH